jgi:fatty acid desaturase
MHSAVQRRFRLKSCPLCWLADAPMLSTKSDSPAFSLTEARAIVRDLFAPVESIYWLDFLATILTGYVCFALTRLLFEATWEPAWLRLVLAATTFVVQCACFYRAVMFVHEIVHLPEDQFVAFRVVWNLLCGIPFLVPSFTYYAHLDHHRRKSFGTADDGEYVPLASMSPWWILIYLSQCLWAAPLVVVRFGLLTPLTWIFPPVRRFIHQRMSSLVMDPTYIRPLPTNSALRIVRLQELACLLFLLACVIVPTVFLHRWPIPFLIQGYLTSVILVFMNCLRTLAGHRYWSNGAEVTFVEQMLDSVTLDNNSPFAVLLNPVGLRYHATHHLFPSMPYHNIRAAHQRLMAQLPADSPYLQTVEHSVSQVIANLWQRAAQHQRHQTTRAVIGHAAMD